MHSIHNEEKSVVAEKFIITLNNKIYKYMTSTSKNDQYGNTYHSTIKEKPADIKSRTYIDFNKGNNKEDPKFKVGDHARI